MKFRLHEKRRLVKTSLILFIIFIFHAAPIYAQNRNLPVYHAPDYGHRVTLTMDYGHGGEADGQTIIWGVNYAVDKQYPIFLVGAGLGLWDPRRDDTDFKFSLAGRMAINPLQLDGPLSLKLQSGYGVHWTEGDEVKTFPIGLGIGWKPLPNLAIAKIEFWATPRYQHRWAGGSGEGSFCSSFGLNVGKAGKNLRYGFRIALDYCDGEFGGGYGFNIWF